MASAKQLGAELGQKREALAAEFAKYKTDAGYDMPADVVESINKRNEELNELGAQWESAKKLEALAADNEKSLDTLRSVPAPMVAASKGLGDGFGYMAPQPSLGNIFAKNFYGRDGAVLKGVEKGFGGYDLPVELKTTMTTSAGFSPENLRSGKVQLSAQRPIRLFDYLPMIPVGVNNNSYVYMLESTFTNNAAEIAENDGTGAAQSALAYTETTQAIRRVATYLPVTDEQLNDVSGIQGLVDSRLTYMAQARLESQLVAGDGNSPNISGYLTQVTQSQAKSSDPVFDAIYKGMVKVIGTGYANPSLVVAHPNDWQDIRLTRTVDGIYILGNPADNVAERIFGVPVLITTAITENTVLVGDFATHSAMVYNQGVQMDVSNSHSDYFIKYLQAIRVSIRAALVVFRITAFCKVTGM